MSDVFWTRFGRKLAAMAAICMMASGCATTGTTTGGGLDTNAVPPNYKQRIADEIRTWEGASAIQSGQITAPHVRWMGLVYGGTRPVVCVMLIRPGLFGLVGPGFYMFYFDNGKPDYVTLGATAYNAYVGCDRPMTPFPEVGRRS